VIAIPETREITGELGDQAPVAHGPAGTVETPDWPPLMLAEADTLLRSYPAARGAARLLTVSPRPFSAASVVETAGGAGTLQQVFVKRHSHAVRSREGLMEEHRVLQFMAGSEWTHGQQLVQAPLADATGETVRIEGGWIYEVHPVAPGVDLYREAHSWTPFQSVQHARAAGRAMAEMHRVLERYDGPPRMAQPLVTSWTIFAADDPETAMEAYLATRPALREYAEERRWRESMQELLLPWYAKLRGSLRHLKPLWTHNDFHASNLMWSADEPNAAVTAIVDFGLSDRTNAVHDLATAIERNTIEWLRMGDAEIVHFDHVDALLAGYEEVRPLNGLERRAIAAMLPLVHCEFALSETDYYLAVLKDRTKAYLGYEGYFLGHAAWFREGEGAELLGHSERWAEHAGKAHA